MPRSLLPGQRADLYVYDLRTSRARLRYSSHEQLFEAPNWSPDSEHLVLNADGLLWRLGAESGDPVQIPMGEVRDINNDHVISPDGATVYVSSDDGHIYAVPFEGGPGHRVTSDKGEGFRHYLHGVSPDGTTLAYIGMQSRPDGAWRTNVHLLDLGSGQERQLTDDDFPDDGAEFSPDGEWVYFNSERGSTTVGHAQLFRVPAAGGEPTQLTYDERVNWFPHPSPDGGTVAYVSFPAGTIGHPENRDVIVRLLAEGGEVRDLVSLYGGQGTMNVPSWAPDGSALAFVAYPQVAHPQGQGA